MTGPHPDELQPDPQLGHLLREHLEAPHPGAFVARVRARLARQQPASAWDILGAWLRPGLLAAAVMLLAVGFLLGRLLPAAGGTSTLEEALRPAGGVAQLIGSTPPSPDRVLAVVLEGGQ